MNPNRRSGSMSNPLTDPYEPPALPEVPVHWLPLEHPAVAAVLVLLLAFGVALVLRGRGSGSVVALAAGAVLAAAVGMAGTLIETDRERIRGSTRDLVRAVAEVDINRLSELLDEGAYYDGLAAPPSGWNKQQILDQVERFFSSSTALESHRVRDIRVGFDREDLARSHVSVTAVPERSGIPTGSWWRLVWTKTDTGWKLERIKPLYVAGLGDVSGR